MGNLRLKSWFFTTSGDTQIAGFWQRFKGGGISKPTQNTFEDLLESSAFKTEVGDGALDNGRTANHSSGNPKQGLVTTALDADIVDDTKVKADYTADNPIVPKAYQMTAVTEETQTLDTLNEALIDVSNTGTTRRNYVVKLATGFITWLGLIRTELTQAIDDILTLDGRLDTVEGDITTIEGDITAIDNRVTEVENQISASSVRLVAIGTSSDNDTFFATTRFIKFSTIIEDPLNGFSSNTRYTIQNNDDGVFAIIAQAGFSGQEDFPTSLSLSININGSANRAVSMQLFNPLMQWRPQVVDFVRLVAGDYIDIIADTTGGTGGDTGVFGPQNSILIQKISN